MTSGTYLARQKCGLNGANLKFAIYNVSAIYKIKLFESTANDSRIIACLYATSSGNCDATKWHNI